MKLLTKIKDPLMPVLLHLVNTTIITSKYPNPLKHTKVIPLLKKDKEETDSSSYRSVNLNLCPSKDHRQNPPDTTSKTPRKKWSNSPPTPWGGIQTWNCNCPHYTG